MKFSVGYQLQDENNRPLAQSLCEISEHIYEVYFPWISTETGRSSLADNRGKIDWNSQAFLEEDLLMLKKKGIRLNLLLNGNCYGKMAVSKYLRNKIHSIIDHLAEIGCAVDTVTTASPFIASMIREKYTDIDITASVNMGIGTIRGIGYLKDIFDGFYLKREHNRNIEYIKEVKAYTDSINKKLKILVNSGCMSHCPMQTFHDNAVSHEQELLETDNVTGYEIAGCWNYYSKKDNLPSLIQNTWIRPEDLYNYEGLFSHVKIATRTNERPLNLIKSYIDRSFHGNVLSLLEPNHSAVLGGYTIDNKSFPHDFFKRTSECNNKCQGCNYCNEVFEMTYKKLPAEI